MKNKLLMLVLGSFIAILPISLGAQEPLPQPTKPVDIMPKVDIMLEKQVDAGEIAVIKAVLKDKPTTLKTATLNWKVTKNGKDYTNIIFRDSNTDDNITADNVLFGVGVSKSIFKINLDVVYNIDDKFVVNKVFEKSITVGKEEEPELIKINIDSARTQLTPIILEWKDEDRENIRIHLSRTYSNLAYEVVNNGQFVKTADFVKLYKNRVTERYGERINPVNAFVEKQLLKLVTKDEVLTTVKRKDIAKNFLAAEILLEEFNGLQPPVPPTPPTPVVPRPDGFAGEVYDQAIKVKDAKNCLALGNALKTFAETLSAQSDFVKIPDDFANVINALKLPGTWTGFGNWSVEQLSLKANTPIEMKALLNNAAIGLFAAGGQK